MSSLRIRSNSSDRTNVNTSTPSTAASSPTNKSGNGNGNNTNILKRIGSFVGTATGMKKGSTSPGRNGSKGGSSYQTKVSGMESPKADSGPSILSGVKICVTGSHSLDNIKVLRVEWDEPKFSNSNTGSKSNTTGAIITQKALPKSWSRSGAKNESTESASTASPTASQSTMASSQGLMRRNSSTSNLSTMMSMMNSNTSSAIGTYFSSKNKLSGRLILDGFEKPSISGSDGNLVGIPFSIGPSGNNNSTYVGEEKKMKCTALGIRPWNWKDQMAERPKTGYACELILSPGLSSDSNVGSGGGNLSNSPSLYTLNVTLRQCTEPEMKRGCQLYCLREAALGGDYDTLHAQVTKGNAVGVDNETLEYYKKRFLEPWRKEGRHVAEGCDRESLKRYMAWDRITGYIGYDGDETIEGMRTQGGVDGKVIEELVNMSNPVLNGKKNNSSSSSSSMKKSSSVTSLVGSNPNRNSSPKVSKEKVAETNGTNGSTTLAGEGSISLTLSKKAYSPKNSAIDDELKDNSTNSRDKILRVVPYNENQFLHRDYTVDKCSVCSGSDDSNCECEANSHCGTLRPTEMLEVLPNAVQMILKNKNADQELYQSLYDVIAYTADKGSVWKSGGKLILSAFNRNQGMQALCRMLDGIDNETGPSSNSNPSAIKPGNKCKQMLMALGNFCEKKYDCYVTAVQINVHTDGSSFHDQHRDIYSAQQRAGPNCTCTFRPAVGTCCFSIGSSRVCMNETVLNGVSWGSSGGNGNAGSNNINKSANGPSAKDDDKDTSKPVLATTGTGKSLPAIQGNASASGSAIHPCSQNCKGKREYIWLKSGTSMYFNGDWNKNHTHGIPKMTEELGQKMGVVNGTHGFVNKGGKDNESLEKLRDVFSSDGSKCGPRISVAYLLGAK